MISDFAGVIYVGNRVWIYVYILKQSFDAILTLLSTIAMVKIFSYFD